MISSANYDSIIVQAIISSGTNFPDDLAGGEGAVHSAMSAGPARAAADPSRIAVADSQSKARLIRTSTCQRQT